MSAPRTRAMVTVPRALLVRARAALHAAWDTHLTAPYSAEDLFPNAARAVERSLRELRKATPEPRRARR